MRKEFEIQGAVEVPSEVTEEEFVDKFLRTAKDKMKVE